MIKGLGEAMVEAVKGKRVIVSSDTAQQRKIKRCGYRWIEHSGVDR